MSQVNLSCMRGDTAEWSLSIVKDLTAVNLTGAKIWMTARRNRGGNVVFQRTSEVGAGITINPDQAGNPGKAVIKLASSSTSSLASETVTMFYDIQCKVGDSVWTVNYGDLVVTPDSTTEIV